MLSRRTLVRAAFAAGLALPAIRHGSARANLSLRIGYVLPAKSQLGVGCTVFAAEIAWRSGGRITVRQFPEAALGSDVELLKSVQLGTLDLAFVAGMGLPSVLPELDV